MPGASNGYAEPAFITRVRIRNYKSIAACDVALGPLTFLVGQNGSGKSNFLDSLRFTADALRTTLDHAIRDRGGLNEVRRRSKGHPTNFGIALEFVLPSGPAGHYAFEIAARPEVGYEVKREECRVGSLGEAAYARYVVERGVVKTTTHPGPAASADRLYLVNVSGLPEFRPVYLALSAMGFYSLNPDRIRDLQSPDAGDLLQRDGSNIASVLAQIDRNDPAAKERIEAFLALVVDGIRGVDVKVLGSKETLEFRQSVVGDENPWRFLASNMSDGTLRALGVLVALFQSLAPRSGRILLVGIEEPEVALHPAAAGVLLDALRAASHRVQVVVTSHSPDLLDDKHIPAEAILAVVAERGITRIVPVDETTRQALADHLYTAGELLRLNQIAPDPDAIEAITTRQPRLFEVIEAP
ncbi:MAG: AAA family ATPase [Dehalococcoidia bacterium]